MEKHYLLLIILCNLGLTVFNVSRFSNHAGVTSRSSAKEYSYIGGDYPLDYPMPPLDTVGLTLQETTHFALNMSDPVADQEWDLLLTTPGGYGRTRLGPDHRLFVMTFYHQFHCLRQIQRGIIARHHHISTPHHVQHCFNYLRELFLCTANSQLEKGDFMTKDYNTDRVGDTLVCQDWETVYDVLDANDRDWMAWKAEWD